ncbi:MAG: tetraacyldisaccharide 4'-kinase [Fimbriimonadales bacterium]|nr:tetraacyldisaccharide 4'-kinase [Fimbriimonadales bacterium]MDW8052712.1 tetraacyldisaccharide 4'-kinase [Armatimonadota bacterium]
MAKLATAIRLERFWQARPPLWLRGLAGLYALGWRVYASIYQLGLKRRHQLPVSVIGVGSLWTGGVGKTPLTIAITRLLHSAGRRVAVLTHGYGGHRYHTVSLIDPHQPVDPAAVGDETAELRMALPEVPIAVGKWRMRVAEAALQRWAPDVLVLDDGFQHLPLGRTLDLVLLPAESPLANGYCLPAGPLREPPSGLRRADVIVLVEYATLPYPTETPTPCPTLAALASDVPLYRATVAPTCLLHLTTGERVPLEALQGQPLTVLCGIARPKRFLQTAHALGYIVDSALYYPDHHAYTAAELQPLSGKTLLTTAKDAVKLRPLLPPNCNAYALLLEAHLEEALAQRIVKGTYSHAQNL